MESIIPYIVKVVLISAILFGYYLLALRNKKFHQYNRFYLLSTVLLSLVLPLVKINFLSAAAPENLLAFVQQDPVSEAIVIHTSAANFWSAENILLAIYLSAVLILGSLFIWSLFRIFSLKRKGEIKIEKEFLLIKTGAEGTPFSFFKMIFWNSKTDLQSTEASHMLAHELEHVRQWHSLDKMVVNIVQIIFWFNPVFWFLRKEINIVHEFLADEVSIKPDDLHHFSKMTLQTIYPGYTWPATNRFFYSPIKRRLAMLLKNKNEKVNYFGRLMVLPLAAFIFLVFSMKSKAENIPINIPANIPVIAVDTVPNNPNLKSLKVITRPMVQVTWKDGKKETLTMEEAKKKGIVVPPPPPPPPPPMSRYPDNALFMIDGKIVGKSEVANLSPQSIKDLSVLKGKAAMEKYGDKGRHGVIEITTINDVENKLIRVEGEEYKDSSDMSVHVQGSPYKIESQNIYIGESNKDTGITNTIERVFTEVEKPASFPGGQQAWSQYITKVIKEHLKDFTDKDYGTSVIKFIVDKNGNVSDVEATTMKGSKLAEAAIDAIRKGPKWVPAQQNGRYVNAYRMQPVTLLNPGK